MNRYFPLLLVIFVGVSFGMWRHDAWAGCFAAGAAAVLMITGRAANPSPPISPEVKRWMEQRMDSSNREG
jgi:hypothetical protein